jgi:hypothetical protein
MSWLPPLPATTVAPPWDETSSVTSWPTLTEKAMRLQEGVAHGRAFTDRKSLARRLLEAGDIPALQDAIAVDRLLCRAVAALWTEDQGLAARTLRRGSLAAAFGDSRLNRLTVHSLISILIRDFARLESWEGGLFDYHASLVQWASCEIILSSRTQRHLVHTVQRHPEWLLTTDAPAAVVDHLVSTGTDLEEFLTDIGLRGTSGGTYSESIRRAFYLKRLSQADPAGDEPVLYEVRSRDVYEAPTADGGYFGQQILEVLSSPTQAPGTTWLDTLLHIAGDPRLTHSSQWVTWWSGIPPQVRQKISGWLSSEDLRLFLGAVEEYGHTLQTDDLQRMFPARKNFLEGLLDLGLIKETRLFMGSDARDHLRLRLNKHIFSDITPLEDSADKETSVIYVDCGNFHLVEGTHSFRLWIYNGQPAATLVDRSKRNFSQKRLRESIPQEFLRNYKISVPTSARELGRSRRHVAVRHHGLWQQKALEALEHFGIHLPADKLMDTPSYSNYRRRVGPTRRTSTVGLTATEMRIRQGRGR